MNYNELTELLTDKPQKWLVTGAAGFIGSHLIERLLQLGQDVVALDNFSTGHQHNLDKVRGIVGDDAWSRMKFIEGDIRNFEQCASATDGVQHVLHQAALGSVPRSIEDPITSNESNVSGFLNMIYASHQAGVSSFTYAASSSTYGDHEALPKKEHLIGNPLSPYAVTKYVNELYASVFARSYDFKAIGLRYFNVFGPRQDPKGAYAAVIPKWIDALQNHEDVFINGDGETSRDFCYVDNVVQANLLSAFASDDAKNEVYNVAVGGRTTLNELYDSIRSAIAESDSSVANAAAQYRDFRPGDVRHSQADISKAREKLGYDPLFTIAQGMGPTVQSFLAETSVSE